MWQTDSNIPEEVRVLIPRTWDYVSVHGLKGTLWKAEIMNLDKGNNPGLSPGRGNVITAVLLRGRPASQSERERLDHASLPALKKGDGARAKECRKHSSLNLPEETSPASI